MEKTNNKINNKLIDYIDGAKDWLEKAKTEYNQDNPVGGELILNLAQAELKYAWELSRSNYVSNSRKCVLKRKFNLLLPVAASIFLIFGLVSGLVFVFGWRPPAAGTHALKITPAITQNQVIRIKTPPEQTGVNSNTISVQKPATEADKLVDQPALANNRGPMKMESQTSETAGRPAGNQNQIENTVFANQARFKEYPVKQPDLHPVSKLVIDEEVLVKEASHSLRNGK